MANARLGWFSPLGLAASIRASARWLAFGFTTSAFRHALIRSGRWAGSFFRLPLRRFRSASWPSGSLLPFFGMHRFGVAAGRVRSFAFRFGDSVRRVGLRVHCFRFSACTDSEWPLGEFVLPPSASEIALGGLVFPLGELAFGFTASAFRHAPLRRLPSSGWPSGSWLPLFGTHRFEVALGGLVFPLGELAFGFTAFAFRHAPLRRLPLGEFVLPSSALEIALGGLTFGLTASAFRHAVLRRLPSAGWFFRLPLRSCRSAGWPSGSPLPLFGMHRFAPPRRRSEDRRSTTTRQLFHFKTLIPTC